MDEDFDKRLNRLAAFRHPSVDPERQIRLLRLWGDASDATAIRGELFTVPVSQLPHVQYKALSYTWGSGKDVKDIREISISGQLFYVRRNLHDFLCAAIQRSNFQTTLFIDAICINQLDTEERRSQVCQMRRIFRNAEQVIAWLGVPDHGQTENVRALSHGLGKDGTNWNQQQWEGLRYLSYSRYWTRIWIVQEVLLASDVTVWCGTFTFPLSLFEASSSVAVTPKTKFASSGCPNLYLDATSRLQSPAQTIVTHRLRHVMRPARHPLMDGTEPRTLEEMTNTLRRPATVVYRYQSSVPDRLHQVLHKFGKSECSDPRDKLYGLLGLLNERTQVKIDPDYDEDVTYACYQALKVGLDDLWPPGELISDMGRSYITYYCDVRDAFGLEDKVTMRILREVLKELGIRERLQDATFEAQWRQQFGLCDEEMHQYKRFEDIVMGAGDDGEPPKGLLAKFHERQYRLIGKLKRRQDK